MKILVCTPCYGMTEPAFTQSLANMMYWTARTLPDVEIMSAIKPGLIEIARTYLVQDAIEMGADYMLWMDADHTFPPNTLVRLLAHKQRIVALNYARRVRPTSPTAIDLQGRPCFTTREKAARGELEIVERVGLGTCLMSMAVITALVKDAQERGESLHPMFFVTVCDRGVDGEDNFFLAKCKALGFDLYVDHALSWECGHVGSAPITHADVQQDRMMGVVKQQLAKP